MIQGSIHARWMYCFLLALLCGGYAMTGSQLKSYLSPIDGSTQKYGLYLPSSYASFPTHPVIFIGHGFSTGSTPSAYFSGTQIAFADKNGFLLVNLYGRGNTFYDGLGEDDFRQVLTALTNDYLIDADRVYFEGASMGATGAYRLGMRHPDILAGVGGADGWGNYRYWYPHWYGPTKDPNYIEPFRVPNLSMSSPYDVAEGAMWQNSYFIVDTNDQTVWPDNTYSLNARLNELGIASAEAGDYAHVMLTFNGGHCAGYNQSTLYNYFLTKKRTPSPPHVIVKTWRLKHGSSYWVRVERLHTVNKMALVDARVLDGQVLVTTTNVTQFTLALTPALLGNSIASVLVNGQQCYTGAPVTLTLYAVFDVNGIPTGEFTTNNTIPVSALQKTAQREGPIGEAYTSPFLVIYGTVGSTAANLQSQSEASSFCNQWNSWMHANITPLRDVDVRNDSAALQNNTLILYGTRECNAIIRDAQPALPITVSDQGITISNREYLGSQYGAYYLFPSPYTTDERYLVISHGSMQGSSAKDLEALPWYWPDYVIFDSNLPTAVSIQSSLHYLPDCFLEAGYFDDQWTLQQPDLLIGAPGATLLGNDRYDQRGQQMVTQTTGTDHTATFDLQLQHDGNASGRYLINSTSAGAGATVHFRDLAGNDLTIPIITSGWLVTLDPGESCTLQLIITLSSEKRQPITITASSLEDAVAVDTVQAVAEQPPVMPLLTGVTLSVANASSPLLQGARLQLNAQPVGGTNLRYKFLACNNINRLTTAITSDYQLANQVEWTPPAGNYTFKVEVKDLLNNKIVRANMPTKFIIYRESLLLPASATLTTGGIASPQAVGINIPLIATVNGTGESLLYKFTIKNIITNVVTILCDYQPSNTITWTPATGNYTIRVDVRDPLSGVTSYALLMRYLIYRESLPMPAHATLTTEGIASPQAVGISIPITATVNGTGEGLLYKFTIKNVLTNVVTMLRDYQTTDTVTWTPTAGNYTIRVDVRDPLSGVTSYALLMRYLIYRDSLPVPASVTLTTGGISSPQAVGTSIPLAASVNGTGDGILYKFTAINNLTREEKVLLDFQTGNMLNWTPATGKYTLRVYIKDPQSGVTAYRNLPFVILP